MPLNLPKPSPTGVRTLHMTLIRDYTKRIRKDEQLRDLVHNRNKIEILPESTERNMEAIEVHCLEVSTPVLTRDLRWVPAGDLREGDLIVGFDEHADENSPDGARYYKEAKITHASREAVSGYEVTLSNGDVLRATGEHQFLVNCHGKNSTNGRDNWARVDTLFEKLNEQRSGTPAKVYVPRYLDVWSPPNSWFAGLLAGAFDADGTLILGKSRGLAIKFVQMNNELLAAVRFAMNVFGFKHSVPFSGKLPSGKDYCFGEYVRGGFEEAMRFLGTVRPPRLLSRWARLDFKHKMRARERPFIMSVKRCDVTVAKISSSSATYMTAGYASHNSGRAGGIIDHANGLLMAPPTWHVDPIDLTTLARRDAETIERALAFVYQQQLLGNDFWPSCGRDVLTYARGFLKIMPLASAWTIQEGYPVRNARESASVYLARIRDWKEREAKFPFIIQHIPAIAILAQLDNNDHVMATIEEKWVTAKVLADEMDSAYVKQLLDNDTLKWYDELPVVEYIDGEWVGYFLSGTEPRRRDDVEFFFNYKRTGQYRQLRVWRHNLGKHPIVLIPGIRTELPELDMRFKSFLADAVDAFEMYDFLLSRLATMVAAYYLPCASEDEPLLLPDGSSKTYGELADTGAKFEVMTKSGNKTAFAQRTGAAPVYEVTLDTGRVLERSEHHRLGVLGERNHVEYVSMDKLQVGDRIPVLTAPPKRRMTGKGGRWLTRDIALALGLLLGDGNLTENGIKFTSSNPAITQVFARAATKAGNPISVLNYETQDVVTLRKGERESWKRGAHEGRNKNIKRRAPILWALQKLYLIGTKSRTKSLPDWTRCLPEDIALALLHGLILSDGSCDVTLGYASLSKNLRDWVADAAWRFGCPGRVSKKTLPDGTLLYGWNSLREFTLPLVERIAKIYGLAPEHAKLIFAMKKNAELLGQPVQRRRHHRKVNKSTHAEWVKSIRLFPEKPIVCVTVVEGDEHLYATPVLEHNSYEWQLSASSAQFAGRDRPTMNVNLGGVTTTYADENLRVLPFPTGLPDANMLLQQVDDVIQRHCVAARDELVLADGRRVKYGDLVNGEKFRVMVPTPRRSGKLKTSSALAYAFSAAIEPLFEITTEAGLKYRFTAHHKVAINARAEGDGRITRLFGRRNINWITADALREGDYVVALNHVQFTGSDKLRFITPDTALVLGLLLSDGCIDARSATFTNTSQEILDLCEDTLKRLCQPYSRASDRIKLLLRGHSGGDHKPLKITQKSAPVLWAINKLGLAGQRSRTKQLPDDARFLFKKSAAALLRGLLLGDGSVGDTGGLGFGSYSASLRDWVAETAHRFGCPGRVKDRIDAYGNALYEWAAFPEFADELITQIGAMTGKLHADALFVPREKRTRRRLNKRLHRQKITSVKLLDPEPTVCVSVIEGDEHVYCDRGGLVTHNTLEDVLFGRVPGSAPAFQVHLRINVAKCADFNEALLLADGTTKTYGALALSGDKFTALTPDGPRLALATLDEIEPLHEITLQGGIKLARSSHHKLFVGRDRYPEQTRTWYDKGSFVRASEVNPGDVIAMAQKLCVTKIKKPRWLSASLGTLIGMLLGDGSVSDHGEIRFTAAEVAVKRFFVKLLPKAARERLRTYGAGLNEDGATWFYLPRPKRGQRCSLVNALKRLELFGVKTYDKDLPSWTRQLPAYMIRAVLYGLLLTDGSTHGGEVEFGSRSRALRDWVAFAAHRLGCPGYLRERERRNRPMYGWEAIQAFADGLIKQLDVFEDFVSKREINKNSPYGWRTRNAPRGFYWERVVSVAHTEPRQAVCVEVLEGDEHVYCTPVLEHNSKLTPIAQHMAMGLTQAGELLLRSIVQLGEAVIIGGEKITVSMAKRYMDRISVAITPKSPVDRNQDIGAAAMALQFGLPWDWIAENILDIEDPATLRLQKDILELEDLPQVKERLMADALDQLEAMIEDDEMTDSESIDLDKLPPEFAQALQGLLGSSGEGGDIESILAGAGNVQGGPQGGPGVGRGPFPPGAAPQTLQGGRGLLTQRSQPEPTSPLVSTALAGLPASALNRP